MSPSHTTGLSCSTRAASVGRPSSPLPAQITSAAPRHGASAFIPGKLAVDGSRNTVARIKASPPAQPASRIQRRGGPAVTLTASSAPVSNSHARANGR